MINVLVPFFFSSRVGFIANGKPSHFFSVEQSCYCDISVVIFAFHLYKNIFYITVRNIFLLCVLTKLGTAITKTIPSFSCDAELLADV